MKIIGVTGAFREESLFVFPTHKDYKLIDYNNKNFLEQESKNADAFVQTNVLGVFKTKMKRQYEWILNQNKPRIVFEQATFRRNLDIKKSNDYYYRVGLNHYTYDEGDFKNKNSSSDRWLKIQKEQDIEIKPWKKKGDYILILTQNPIDTSLNNIVKKTGDYENYLKQQIVNISKMTGEDILIRFHPRFVDRFKNYNFNDLNIQNKIYFSNNLNNYNITNGGVDFYKDLENARIVVSYSSNGLIEAACEGVPVITESKTSHAWPIAFHSLNILKEKKLPEIDRTQWLYDCAYTQWKLSEINNGIVHQRLINDSK
jgi:hypothetical protein